MPTYDHGVSGLVGTIGVTIYNANRTLYAARATAGITEPVAGSGIYDMAHPAAGTMLGFFFDGGVGTIGASVWDDGLATPANRIAPATPTDVTNAQGAITTAISEKPVTPATDLTATNAAIAALGADIDGLTVPAPPAGWPSTYARGARMSAVMPLETIRRGDDITIPATVFSATDDAAHDFSAATYRFDLTPSGGDPLTPATAVEFTPEPAAHIPGSATLLLSLTDTETSALQSRVYRARLWCIEGAVEQIVLESLVPVL